MPIDFINKSEFARRAECDEKQVRRAIEKGSLLINSEGLLDANQLQAAWRKSNRRSALKKSGQKKSDTSDISNLSEVSESFLPSARSIAAEVEDDESAEEAAERFLRAQGATLSYAQALELKENYLAKLKQLEFQIKDGSHIEIKIAQEILFSEFRAVRDAWLNWPIKIGPLLAADLGSDGADLVTELLTKHVHKQIADLGEPSGEFSAGKG